jgi:hypothetical protein
MPIKFAIDMPTLLLVPSSSIKGWRSTFARKHDGWFSNVSLWHFATTWQASGQFAPGGEPGTDFWAFIARLS